MSESFQVICRVVDSKFSHVSPSMLFALRASAPDAKAVRAFDSLVGPELAALFEQAVGLQLAGAQLKGKLCHDFGDVAMTDATLAKSLAAATREIDAKHGGLYQGRLDHLRSTVCNPELGMDASGCCVGCLAITRDPAFQERLRVTLSSGRAASSGASSKTSGASSKTNKRVLSIDEARSAAESKEQQARAREKVVVRLQGAAERWRGRFEAAMAGAAAVVDEMKASVQTGVGALLEQLRAKASEVAALEQSVAAARLETEQGMRAAAMAQDTAAQDLATARTHAALELAQLSAEEHSRMAAGVEQMRNAGKRAMAGAEVRQSRLVEQHRLQLAQLERDLEREFARQLAKVEEQHATELSSFPEYIQNLIKAEKLGNVSEHPACVDIISGIATCLAKNSTHGRRLNETEKQFYAILLNSQSPWAEKFVSHNLMGPNIRYIKKLRSARTPEIAMEVGEASMAEVLVPLMTEHGLLETPGGICEDGTTTNKHLDWERVERDEPASPCAVEPMANRGAAVEELAGGDASAEQTANVERAVSMAEHVTEATWRRGIRVWGMVGGPVVVHSLDELLEVFTSKTRAIARYVYVYTWVPTAKHAPWFPFILLASDNKFTGAWVWQMWRRLHRAAAKLRLLLTWHGSDGDSRLRLAMYTMMLYENRTRNGGWCDQSYRLEHPLMLLHVPCTIEGLWLISSQDLVHLLFRWRRQLCDDKKTLHHGTYLACKRDLRDIVSESALDYSNKQNWPGVMEIFCANTCNILEQKIAAGEDHRRGTYLYCVMGTMLLNAWFAEADEATNGWTPGQSIKQAACVMAHEIIWRNSVAKKGSGLKLAHDCQTRETILDTVLSCSACIYRFPHYRDHHPNHKPYGPNFGHSRHSEYGFQKCRMEEATNCPSLSFKGFFTAFKHVLFQVSLEATSELRIPHSLRGVPHSVGRVQPDPPSPAYRHETEDLQVRESMLAGFQEAVRLWKLVVHYDVDITLPGFFEDPWKHFDLPSELHLKMVDGKEDGEDEAVAVALDSKDADDAAELMGRLIASCAERLGGAAPPTPDAADLELQRAIGPLFREFNGGLSYEAYLRKHRFRTHSLVKDSADKEAAVLKEDGDIVAVFEADNGDLYWLPGRIDMMTVAKSDFDDSRISDVELQRIEKACVKEVAIDDRRGIFLMRWYVEVDKDGADLVGFQNKGCAGYRLTSDNNGEPFRWMSNYQVLLPVEMRRHYHASCKMYRIHSSDLSLVRERFEVVRGGGAAASGSAQPTAPPAATAGATAAASEPERAAAAKKATEIRNAARAESIGRREDARARQQAAEAARKDAKRRKP